MTKDSRSKSPEQNPGDGGAGGGRSRLRWVIGWLVVPALFVGGLFAVGVHVGARHPDMLLTRGVLWLTNAEAERAPPAASERVELVFAWPLPAQASVTEWVDTDGKSTKLRYQLEVEAQGGQLIIRHRDFRLVEAQGQPIERYSNRAEVEAQLLPMASYPVLVASQDGEFIGVRELDPYIERVVEAIETDPEAREELVQFMHSPQAMAAIEQEFAEIWRGYGELWAGLEIASDQELRLERDGGVGVYRVVELDAETVSLEFRLERELERSELFGVLGALTEATDDPAQVMAEFEGVTGGKAVVATATLRRDTLLPLECTRQTDSWLDLPGEARREEREVHRYTFEWR